MSCLARWTIAAILVLFSVPALGGENMELAPFGVHFSEPSDEVWEKSVVGNMTVGKLLAINYITKRNPLKEFGVALMPTRVADVHDPAARDLLLHQLGPRVSASEPSFADQNGTTVLRIEFESLRGTGNRGIALLAITGGNAVSVVATRVGRSPTKDKALCELLESLRID